MPKVDGVGRSEYTKEKQSVFRRIVQRHIGKVKGITEYRSFLSSRYAYIDLTSGPGSYSHSGDVIDGSPLIVIDEAKKHGMELDAYLFEENIETAKQLRKNLHDRIVTNHKNVHPESWEKSSLNVLNSLENNKSWENRLGLIYLDPNGVPCTGHDRPWIECINELLTHPIGKRLDLLVHISATSYKRTFHLEWRGSKLIEDIKNIKRKHKYIRTPVGRHQWTFILMTNHEKSMSKKNLSKLMMHDLTTPDGLNIAERMNEKSRDVKEAGQLRLFYF